MRERETEIEIEIEEESERERERMREGDRGRERENVCVGGRMETKRRRKEDNNIYIATQFYDLSL